MCLAWDASTYSQWRKHFIDNKPPAKVIEAAGPEFLTDLSICDKVSKLGNISVPESS